ncbi:DNA-binding response regulator [Clostridia bacterium]|nr:DNA-binding response regulator [Clostridia bacterium]
MPLIYIVEDNIDIREIESYTLKNSGFRTTEFESGQEFAKAMEQTKPDLIILDVMLPGEDGLEILRNLRSKQETKKIPIILVTAKSSELDKVKGLDLGADDYITKPFGVMELVSRVKALLRRMEKDVKSEDSVLTAGGLIVDEGKRSVRVDGEAKELTYKEFELLKFFLLNKGIVLSRDKIMDRVWGFEYEGESRTVDMHIKTLRKKLGEGGNLIKTVRNVGYLIDFD